MRVLVTGGAGYVGSVLCRRLLEKGHRVVVLDAMFFGDRGIRALCRRADFTLLKGDIRSSRDIQRALEDADAVVHLAALVGEPAAQKWPGLNQSINIQGTKNLLDHVGDRLLVYASSCSVYGNQEGLVDEESPVFALGPYAQSRIEGEEMIRRHPGPSVILRFATVFGLSPRMRFDLLVNEFTLAAWRDGTVEIYNPAIIRPFISVHDLAEAVARALETPLAVGQTINIGAFNLSKGELAETVVRVASGSIKEVARGPDVRNYTVSFDKMKRLLGFKPGITVEQGAREILTALERGEFPHPEDPVYYNHSPVYGE